MEEILRKTVVTEVTVQSTAEYTCVVKALNKLKNTKAKCIEFKLKSI